jgi:hypothetical protein
MPGGENGFGPAIAFAILEIRHRFLEIEALRIGEAARGGLPRGIFDPIVSEAPPVIDPHPAKGAIAIEDEYRVVWHFLITPFDGGIFAYSQLASTRRAWRLLRRSAR